MFGDKLKTFGKANFGSVKALAEALEMLPQQLSAYISETKKPGMEILSKLNTLGCDIAWLIDENKPIDLLSKTSQLIVAEPQPSYSVNSTPIYLDVSGAMELTRSPSRRLSQLIQVAPGTLEAWESGESVPTVAQLGALFNQVVALGLARCAEHDHRPAVREERKVAAG